MQQDEVAEASRWGGPAHWSGFLGLIADDYNARHGRPQGTPVGRFDMAAWLHLPADTSEDHSGLSVLESEILRHRADVREAVLEKGVVNACRLRLWAITHGAHELGLDTAILADTIEHALALKGNVRRSPVTLAQPKG